MIHKHNFSLIFHTERCPFADTTRMALRVVMILACNFLHAYYQNLGLVNYCINGINDAIHICMKNVHPSSDH